MCGISEILKNQVWEKGQIIAGYDSSKIRKDACGAWICKDNYGDKTSDFGWEVDHIYPKSRLHEMCVPIDLINDIQNLRPLHWMNNESKSDSYPEYRSIVGADGNKNKTREGFFRVSDETQEIISRLFEKYFL